jgi:hypothetical protein
VTITATRVRRKEIGDGEQQLNVSSVGVSSLVLKYMKFDPIAFCFAANL